MAGKERKYKNCPFCAEEILVGAIKCKHCKSDLETAPPVPPVPSPSMSDYREEVLPPGYEEKEQDDGPPAPVSYGEGPPPIPPESGEDKEAPEPPRDSPPPLPQAPAGPPSVVQPAGKGYQYPKSSSGMRILAYIIDSIIAGLPMMILVPLAIIPFFTYTQVTGQPGGPSPAGSNAVAIILVVIIGLLGLAWSLFYYLLRDGFGAGQSWGKKICGLMVVNLDDNMPCDKGKSFVRNIVIWALSALAGLSIVELIMLLVHDRGFRLGDMLARTQVIDVDQYRK